MDKLDLIILTSIIATSFIIFIVATYRELSGIDENSYKTSKDGGPRVELLNMVGRLFEDERIPKKEKKIIYKAMFRTMADMESDGVHFPEDVKLELIRQREELTCEYSGLPSMKVYESLQKSK